MEIERGGKEPIPPPKPGPAPKYPFDEMEKGETFIIRCKPEERKVVRNRVHSAAYERGVTISTRSVDEGIKVWLVSKTRKNRRGDD